MNLPVDNWSNVNGSGERKCRCGSWKQHWINFSGKEWPSICSVKGCYERPVLGAHVRNPDVKGEKIIPMCWGCNQLENKFSLKDGVTCVSANMSETCG